MTLLTAGRSVRVFTRAAALSFCLVLGMGAAATAHAEPAYAAYLDLPSVNGDGAGAGGLNALLPLDEADLAEALRQARADSVAPRRYATLLHQYWLVIATRNADIDVAAWDPGRAPVRTNALSTTCTSTICGWPPSIRSSTGPGWPGSRADRSPPDSST
ncbi:hypothetical protein [Nocardia abscessus]|uniref:hypothetical protein n=1 Tax=Nocardia abscessus TaxID=120957 RepID=UPI002455B459|nr:hypothetical protein [Nocardia abscessus]